jgi:hypothetical protein
MEDPDCKLNLFSYKGNQENKLSVHVEQLGIGYLMGGGHVA